MSRFLPEPERASPPPPVLLTGLRIAGAPQNVSALGETEVRLADLPASANQLEIDFVGLGFGSGESLRYQYRLEGADSDWSAPTAQRTVTYARLASGRYRFLVRALSADGQVSAKPAVIIFGVLPPLWARWWFRGRDAGLQRHRCFRVARFGISNMAASPPTCTMTSARI
jgi:hypothetical protein